MCLRGGGLAAANFLPVPPTRVTRQSLCRPQIPLVVTVGGVEEKPVCFKQKPISKFPTLAHQSDEGPAHVVNLSACPLPSSTPPPGLGHRGSRKKPAAAAVNPGSMTKPIRPFKSRRKIELNAANGDGRDLLLWIPPKWEKQIWGPVWPKIFLSRYTQRRRRRRRARSPAVIHLRKTNT